MSTTPQFEIPTDMRKMTEQSLAQVRTAINGYLQFFQRAVPHRPNCSDKHDEGFNKVYCYPVRRTALRGAAGDAGKKQQKQTNKYIVAAGMRTGGAAPLY